MIYDDQTSSAMNYYEELGVSQQATEQEIRKAHRRLVKLMHPDAQPDAALKLVAETQMRRLNSIVSTLLDPQQRSAYDEELREQTTPRKERGAGAAWQGIPWWLASAVGAVVLTLVAVWLWADHLGNTFGNRPRSTVSIPPMEGSPSATQPQVPAVASPDSGASDRVGASYTPPISAVPETSGDGKGISAAIISDPPAKKEQAIQPVVKPQAPKVVAPAVVTQPKIAGADSKKKAAATLTPVQLSDPKPKKIFSLPPGSLIANAAPASTKGGSQMPTPPGVVAQAGRDYSSSSFPGSSLPTPVPPKPADVTMPTLTSAASPRDPLEGEWVYAPKEPERRRAGFYPPEYIDLKLFGSGDVGSLKGQYSAKYVVTDRPVSPEVSFQLASVSKGSRKFLWQSNDGAKGTLSIDSIDERTIRIDWHTTTATRSPALTSGQATLIRRQ